MNKNSGADLMTIDNTIIFDNLLRSDSQSLQPVFVG